MINYLIELFRNIFMKKTRTQAVVVPPVPFSTKPIMWFHNLVSILDTDTIRIAAKSKVINTVILWYGGIDDRETDMKAQNAVLLCKSLGLKVIWCRTIFPLNNAAFPRNLVFQSDYYTRMIRTLRGEMIQLGADFCCFDTEAYPQFPYMKDYYTAEGMTEEKYKECDAAVIDAIASAGKVNYALPSTYLKPAWPIINALDKLAVKTISEFTYYNYEHVYAEAGRVFDVFGAKVNTTADHTSPYDKFWTPETILQRRDLWETNKSGLMLYPLETNIPAIAEMIGNYKW